MDSRFELKAQTTDYRGYEVEARVGVRVYESTILNFLTLMLTMGTQKKFFNSSTLTLIV